ncbi:MAG TPA: GNVR domain-containing protein [Clostridia bacterium]|nr:GNVR domain-containing protein [Clostridia bacterium]
MESTVFDASQERQAPNEGAVNNGGSDPREREMSYIRLLWRRRRTLYRAATYGLLASVVISLCIPNWYRAQTQLMPPDGASSNPLAMLSAFSGGSPAMGGLASSLFGIKNTGDLFVGILHSRTVRDGLINKFDLRKIYRTKYYETARKKLGQKTEISEDRKSGIITISVTDKDPKRAAEMAQEYVAQLDRSVAQLSTSSAHRERVFLDERLRAVKQELDIAAKDLSQFSSKNTTIDIKEQGRAMVEAAALLQGQLMAAQTELSGLEAIYTPNNIRVRSVQARIAELKKQVEKLRGSDASLAGPDASGSYPSIRSLPIIGVTYVDLLRRTKIQEAVFETLTKEYELAKVQEAKEIPTVKVLDAAVVPEKKSGPPRTILVLVGTALCFMCASLWVLAGERWARMADDDSRKVLLREAGSAVRPLLARFGSRKLVVTQEK